MKTSVKSIKTFDENNTIKVRSIRTEDGELKTHLLEKLLKSGVVVPDSSVLKILLELLLERKKEQNKKPVTIEKLEPIKVSSKYGKRRRLNPEDRFFPEKTHIGIVPRIGFSDRRHDLTKEERKDLLMEMSERM